MNKQNGKNKAMKQAFFKYNKDFIKWVEKRVDYYEARQDYNGLLQCFQEQDVYGCDIQGKSQAKIIDLDYSPKGMDEFEVMFYCENNTSIVVTFGTCPGIQGAFVKLRNA